MAHHVLVTYGSKRGGTAEIAAKIAQTLRAEGIDADWSPVAQVDAGELEAYDAVILGGALYAGRWIASASRFARKHRHALRQRDVWMFSSGPLDDSASRHDIAPTPRVRALMARTHARGHITFGGRLAPDAKGFAASAMAKTRAGDWRDLEKVSGWARSIAKTLHAQPARGRSQLIEPPARGLSQLVDVPASGVSQLARGSSQLIASPARPALVHRWLLAALCAFVGATALVGGLALIARPDGSLVHFPPETLAHSPFSSFLIPGILLSLLVGGTNLAATMAVALRSRLSNHIAFAGGAALFIWITTQLAMIRTFHPFQLVYVAAAIAIMGDALARWLATRVAGVRHSDKIAV